MIQCPAKKAQGLNYPSARLRTRQKEKRMDRLPNPVILGFPGGSAGKESASSAGDLGSIPGLGRSSGEGKGYQLQYSGLENFTDCLVHRVAKSTDTTERLSLALHYDTWHMQTKYLLDG